MAVLRMTDIVHVHVAIATGFEILLRHARVCRFVVVVGRDRDDVPRMQEAREEAQDAQGDVDDRVCGTETTFDPDGQWWEDDGEDAKKSVCCAHVG